MSTPFFSIIIPTLNEEEYIGRLLEDLTGQNEKRFEVCVVDGNSTDQTLTMASKFLDQLPLTLLTSPKKNVSFQRNFGAQKARGHYIIFFDADVQIPPYYLKKLAYEIEKSFPAYATTYLIPDSDEVYDEMLGRVYNVFLELSLFIERPFVPGFNFMVRKRVFETTGGFDEKIIHAEDYDLSVRIFKEGYRLTIFKEPKLIFSLRRYRAEGRLAVMRKYAKSTLHVLTKGPITKDIFSYPMGGGWYKDFKNGKQNKGFAKAERYVKRLVKAFLE